MPSTPPSRPGAARRDRGLRVGRLQLSQAAQVLRVRVAPVAFAQAGLGGGVVQLAQRRREDCAAGALRCLSLAAAIERPLDAARSALSATARAFTRTFRVSTSLAGRAHGAHTDRRPSPAAQAGPAHDAPRARRRRQRRGADRPFGVAHQTSARPRVRDGHSPAAHAAAAPAATIARAVAGCARANVARRSGRSSSRAVRPGLPAASSSSCRLAARAGEQALAIDHGAWRPAATAHRRAGTAPPSRPARTRGSRTSSTTKAATQHQPRPSSIRPPRPAARPRSAAAFRASRIGDQQFQPHLRQRQRGAEQLRSDSNSPARDAGVGALV